MPAFTSSPTSSVYGHNNLQPITSNSMNCNLTLMLDVQMGSVTCLSLCRHIILESSIELAIFLLYWHSQQFPHYIEQKLEGCSELLEMEWLILSQITEKNGH